MSLTTAQWIRRIENLRYCEGFDGSTLSTPILAAFVVPWVWRDTCPICDRDLSPPQIKRAQRTCSWSCASTLRERERRERRQSA